MSERKNIERLFQEKFKDFEEVPPPRVWENISSKLENKEIKKTTIPLWLKASGIAAVLLLGYLTADNYPEVTHFNTIWGNSETVVSSGSPKEGNNQKKNDLKTATKDNVGNNQIPNQKNAVVIHESNLNNEASVSETNPSDLTDENLVSSQKSKDAKKRPFGENRKAGQINSEKQLQPNTADGIAIAPKYKKSKGNKSNAFLVKENRISSSYNENQFVAHNDKNTNSAVRENSAGANQNQITGHNDEKSHAPARGNSSVTDQNQFIAQNNRSEYVKQSEDDPFNKSNNDANGVLINEGKNASVANVENQYKKENKNSSTNIPNGKEGNSSFVNAINQKGSVSEKTAKDSIIVAVVAEENPLDKILKEKEIQDSKKIAVAENTSNWKVRPNVAPLFMSAGQGSPIDSQFADNAKNYETNLSIGLGLDYALNSKISIRTGINKFDLGYNTNDISYYVDLKAKTYSDYGIKTINLKPQASGMIIEDIKTSANQELAFQNKEEGYLNQRFGYVEVPFEVSYKLMDDKFGVQVFTGLSTLFLNENKISVVSNGLSTEIGEANNLNKIHFSTNIGIGFKYSFWKSFEANFEPTFKYQINTFNANSGGFKPYLIGLYTGVSFRF